MNLPVSAEKPLLLRAPAIHRPSVVILTSFEPKMKAKQELESGLKLLLEQAGQRLMAIHSSDEAMPVIRRLQFLVRKLDYSTHRRAVAVFVSADVEKVCYLDMEVETRVFIDENISVSDLAGYRRPNRDFLVLAIDSRQSRMYLSQGGGLRLIKSNAPQTGTTEHKFLYQMDHGLDAVLKLYPLPVFVVGPETVAAHFNSITRNNSSIASYLHGSVDEAAARELLEYVKPELADFGQIGERVVAQQVEEAAVRGRLVQGIQAVARAAGSRNGRLLVIENEDSPRESRFYKNGLIDEIAEKVLISGGEIEVVKNGVLKDYEHIVLLLRN
ncbi:MAG TPA: hypothetical protein VI233_02545 [Puia sp.]